MKRIGLWNFGDSTEVFNPENSALKHSTLKIEAGNRSGKPKTGPLRANVENVGHFNCYNPTPLAAA